jgi:hypothetical protein
MATMMCVHLRPLEEALIAASIPETFRGQAWGGLTAEWVYFACQFDLASIRLRLKLAESVVNEENADPKSGLEIGFRCTEHGNAVMAVHPLAKSHLPVFKG